MNIEETDKQKQIREISEQKNPYDKICPNRHLWSEGFRAGYNFYLVGKTQQIELSNEISPRVAKLIIQIRDLFIEAKDTPLDTMEEIWHFLYQIASPNYDKLCEDVWSELEEIANKYFGMS